MVVLNWKCGNAPLKPQMSVPRSVCGPGQHGGAGCPAEFHLPGKGLEELQGHRELKEGPFASEMAGFEAGGTP